MTAAAPIHAIHMEVPNKFRDSNERRVETVEEALTTKDTDTGRQRQAKSSMQWDRHPNNRKFKAEKLHIDQEPNRRKTYGNNTQRKAECQ